MTDKLFNVERPMMLDSVKGHEVVVDRIRHWFETDSVPSFILCEGCRGCGKTTISRIIGKYLNCDNPSANGPCGECESCRRAALGNNMDIIELDAASKNKVDDILALKELILYVPHHKKKVVILDEVHRLSDAAFSALLKLLEEPPAHCVFIFCTTEAQKIPDTIRSRARQLTFSALPVNIIAERLREICDKYGVEAEDEALILLAKNANGAMRDAVNYLEDFFDGKITVGRVREGLGVPDSEVIFTVIDGMLDADYRCITAFREAVGRGVRLNVIVEHLVRTCMDVSQFLICGDMSLIDGTESYKEGVLRLSKKATFVRFAEFVKSFGSVRYVGVESYQVESLIVSTMIEESSISLLSRKIEQLENEITELKAREVVCSNVVAPAVISVSSTPVVEESLVITPSDCGVFAESIAEGFVDIADAEVPFDMVTSMPDKDKAEQASSQSTNADLVDDYYSNMAISNQSEMSSCTGVNTDVEIKTPVIEQQAAQTTEVNPLETRVFAHDCDSCENLEICVGPDECILDAVGPTAPEESCNTGAVETSAEEDDGTSGSSSTDTFSALFGDMFSF